MTNVHTKVEKNERLHNQATALSWGLLYANNHLCFILQVIESHGKVKQGNDIVIFAFREESFWSDGTVLSWLGVVKLIYVCQSLSRVRLFATPWTVACQAPLSIEFSKNTGVDSCSLLQGIFLTKGWNPSLLHCRQILYRLSHVQLLTFWPKR